MSTSNYVFACGGGVQSTACLVLASKGLIPYRTFIFANVGEGAESPATLSYIESVLKPFASKHGLIWVDVAWVTKSGYRRDLYEDLLTKERDIPIPAYMPGGMPGNRKCTEKYKIEPIARWIKANARGCFLGKGISTDESHRATPSRETDAYISQYPLIELGIDRAACLRIAQEAGLPQPPKSSCWFCPFKTTNQWVSMRRTDPAMFEKAVALESTLQARRARLGKDPVYLSSVGGRKKASLDRVIPHQLSFLWEPEEGCESGYCMT